MTSEAWLEEMSQSVVTVTKGFDKPDRKYAYNYLRKHVLVDEIHQLAIRKFRGKTIEFGTGSLHPEVVVVTKDPITKEQKERLVQAWKKLDIPPDEVYYAHLRFVKTKQKQEIRHDILNRLVQTLEPGFLLAFDGVRIDYDGDAYQTKDPISIVTDAACKAERQSMMRALKNMN
ncbi:hypothetical protein D3C76_613930 [compost metagenome]